MINSKVNFYFYKKGNQNNIKHIERILLSELPVELDSAKAVSPKGEGRPSCSWLGQWLIQRKGPAGTPDGASYKAESHQLQSRKGMNCAKRGNQWGCCAEEVQSSLAHSDELGDGEAWNFKKIFWLGFALPDYQ